MSSWTALDEFLTTDPMDVGCDRALEILHLYVDLLAAGEDVQGRYPGVTAHLAQCGPCNEDFQGLLAAVAADERPM
ncbi:MAG: hypothetical protein J2P15_05180 [Micromonosporaceae bacterium]|nr:hypothetical protein [Micromonosporaceae bacterium]